MSCVFRRMHIRKIKCKLEDSQLMELGTRIKWELGASIKGKLGTRIRTQNSHQSETWNSHRVHP